MFIELTNEDGKRFLVNIRYIETVKPWAGKTKIGFNVGSTLVLEDYDLVHSMIINKERDFQC
jgi:uncharacterized protein YlzI (FlbEa/FlbD family)